MAIFQPHMLHFWQAMRKGFAVVNFLFCECFTSFFATLMYSLCQLVVMANILRKNMFSTLQSAQRKNTTVAKMNEETVCLLSFTKKCHRV